jgi:hypothetical protein
MHFLRASHVLCCTLYARTIHTGVHMQPAVAAEECAMSDPDARPRTADVGPHQATP